jgi:hypothetical protein
MKGKITLLIGGAVGYVLGTRAGRERYEQIKSQARGLWNNPKVQDAAGSAQDYARQKAPEVQQKVAEAAGPAASTAKDKVGGGRSDDKPTATYPNASSAGDGFGA